MSSEKRKAPIWREGMLCPECGNDILIHDPRTGEVTCPSCGYVVQERDVDRGPEWRNLDEERIGVGLAHRSR